MGQITGRVAKILTLDSLDDARAPNATETLEAGGLIYLENAAFGLSEREARLIANASATLPTRKERKSRNGRPTVIFEPSRGRILHARMKPPERTELENIMSRFADWATALVNGLFPNYRGQIERDRTTYRPCERATMQGLHVDASYGRPTGGCGMLRVFYNVNPHQQARVWRVGETFEAFAQRFVPNATIKPISLAERLLYRINIIKGKRTLYDHVMEEIRTQAKSNKTYQAECPQKIVGFPPGSAWIAITDLVLHGAVSGQHSLDQTFFVPANAMDEPNRSSLKILERLTGRALA
ncbi:MAG: Kdo hydroxylase family protein [Nitrococcus sp.]|nr:Kdo hydroxylase family protein [Nitrococcus sp.]